MTNQFWPTLKNVYHAILFVLPQFEMLSGPNSELKSVFWEKVCFPAINFYLLSQLKNSLTRQREALIEQMSIYTYELRTVRNKNSMYGLTDSMAG